MTSGRPRRRYEHVPALAAGGTLAFVSSRQLHLAKARMVRA